MIQQPQWETPDDRLNEIESSDSLPGVNLPRQLSYGSGYFLNQLEHRSVSSGVHNVLSRLRYRIRFSKTTQQPSQLP